MRLRREYLSNPQFFDKYISETIIKFRPSYARQTSEIEKYRLLILKVNGIQQLELI